MPNKPIKQAMDEVDPLKDDFFMEVSNTKPFFKAALEGFAGSGKTYTAAQVAIGLHKKINSKKPVVMFDTEKAAKFLKPMFAKAGIQLLVKESKSMADLITTMRKMKDGTADILLIDSITHIWENFLEAYKQRVNRTQLQFQDWGIIKPSWKAQFSDPFVNDPYHVIMTGRAGYEYDSEINPDTKRREIHKSGVKMKVEGETAYEPDLLVLMERYQEMENGSVKQTVRSATIIKDRSTVIDGKTFENPTFKDFEPAIDVMLANPDYRLNQEADSTGLFRTEEDKGKYIKSKEIALEEIEGQLLRAWPSTGASDKQAKAKAINEVFKTYSWTAVTQMALTELKRGLEELTLMVEAELVKQFPDVAEREKAKKERVKVKT